MASVNISTTVKRTVWGTAPPTAGTFNVADECRNSDPSEEGANPGVYGWFCIAAGTPGDWAVIGSGVGGGGEDLGALQFEDGSYRLFENGDLYLLENP